MVIIKAGVHMNVVFPPLNMGSIEISRSRFTLQEAIQKLSALPTIACIGCFINFWVIFGYIWKEIVFLKGLVKLEAIRNLSE